jgi:hypothetical protein
MKKPNDFTKTAQYPQRDYYHDERAFTDMRLAYDRIQQLEDRVSAMTAGQSEGKKVEGKGGKTKEPETKINGLRIKAVPPQNGQKLTYNSATGQIEWQ